MFIWLVLREEGALMVIFKGSCVVVSAVCQEVQSTLIILADLKNSMKFNYKKKIKFKN